MFQPLTNLILFCALATAAVLLRRPVAHVRRWGWRGRPRRRRERVEDALKHIYHQSDRDDAATLSTIGGALEIPAGPVLALLERMQSAGLVTLIDGRIVLTSEGRQYALQVIRAHRLWERYLADETGVDPMAWHSEAERREHLLTPDDADALASRLGHPRFDPHGDPIPTSQGVVPDRTEALLSSLEPGQRARVVHIEDEPAVVYAQVVASGLYPGMFVRCLDRGETRLVYEADGRSLVLAPIVAANVSVVFPRNGAQVVAEAAEADATLNDLAPGEAGEVVRISPATRGFERRRLMDLGIVPGTRIELDRCSPSGGLAAYRIRRTLVALREEQARCIAVRRLPEDQA